MARGIALFSSGALEGVPRLSVPDQAWSCTRALLHLKEADQDSRRQTTATALDSLTKRSRGESLDGMPYGWSGGPRISFP